MRFLKLPFIICLLFVYIASCKKDSSSLNLTPSFYFLNGDTSSLSAALILFGSTDTTTYNLYVSSTYLTSKIAEVTLGIADTARVSYNAYHGTSYQAMPATAYSFNTTFNDTTTTVYDTIPVLINKSALNPAINYMLPIQIINASGNSITPGASIIYLHIINNKLSGVYNSTGFKTLYTGDAASNVISEKDTFAITKNIIPSPYPNVSQVDYADLGSNGWQYYLSFNNSTFTVSENAVIDSSVQAGSFKILSSTYDSTNNNIDIKSSYKNLTGDERIIEESLKLQ